MANKLYDEASVQAIANAIRSKNKTETKYKISQMAQAIEDIPSIIKRKTGNPIEFSDGADAPLVKCVTQITGSQDLHGQDKPWVGGAGANMLSPVPIYSNTVNGVTITSDGNGNYTLNGVASATVSIDLTLDTPLSFPNSNVYLHLRNTSASGDVILVLLADDNTQLINRGANNINQVSVATNKYGNTATKIRFYISSGTNVNMTLSPMVLNTATIDKFYPYSNICPIVAYTEGEIEVRGKNKLPMIVSDIKSVNTDGTWTNNQYQLNGVTFDLQTNVNGDITGIKVNGTSSALTRLWIMTNENMVDYSSCILSMKNATANCSFIILQRVSPWTVYAMANSDSDVVIQNASDNAMFYIEILANKTVNTTLYPMIRYVGSSPDFVPYIAPTTHTTTYPSAIYRGSEDVVNGEVTSEWKVVDLGDLNYILSTNFQADLQMPGTGSGYTDCICEQYIMHNVAGGSMVLGDMKIQDQFLYICDPRYNDANTFKSAVTGVKLAYELATPTTSSVTPSNLPIKSLYGYNHIESSTGEMDIEYITEGYQNFVDTVESALPNTTRNLLSASKGGTKAMDIFLSLDTFEKETTSSETTETEENNNSEDISDNIEETR